MAYTSEQRRMIALARQLSAGSGPRVRRALLEAMAVESSYRNLNYGDRDSQGVLQQRPSQGWGPAGNARADIQQFLSRARALASHGFHGSAGQLAQAVQHSAFPGRYDQHAGEAAKLLGGATGAVSASLGSGAGAVGQNPGSGSGRAAFARQLLAAEQGNTIGKPFDITKLVQAAVASRQPAAQPATQAEPAAAASAHHHQPSTAASGVGNFEGHKVAAWIVPVLRQARAAGWKGTVTSGYRSLADQTRIYNSGVRPAARPGTSNHEFTSFPGGAVDVSSAAQLAAILRRLGIHSLRWAGAKDPVHFSHPHGGSY